MSHRQISRKTSQKSENVKIYAIIQTFFFILHAEDGFYIIKQTKDIVYIKRIF